jgi:hypothetical protein
MFGLCVMRMVLVPGFGAVPIIYAAVVFVRRHHETAFGEVRGLLDILEASDLCGLVRSVILTGIDLPDGNADLTEGVSKGLRQCFAIVVEIALGSDVFKVERIGIGLIGESGAMAYDNHKPSRAQGLRDLHIVRGRARHREAEPGKQAKGCRKRGNGSS